MRRPPEPVPVERLAPDTLARLVRELVLREDANDDPRALAARVEAAQAAVLRGALRLWFHPDDGAVTWTAETPDGRPPQGPLPGPESPSETASEAGERPSEEEY